VAQQGKTTWFANLRSAVWRPPADARGAVNVVGDRLSLDPSVSCDVIELRERISRLTGGGEISDGDDLDVTHLIGDLLPSWYEDWVFAERERLRHSRIRALEVLCQRLTALGRFGEAVEAGLAAVTAEPLRESAHRVLISAHMAEGNRSEARRQYELYVKLLHQDLGVSPSLELRLLVSECIGE
jgi:DNA-binding SARP family transcriptional activator